MQPEDHWAMTPLPCGIWVPYTTQSSSGSDPSAPVGPGAPHGPSTFLPLSSAVTTQGQGVWEPLSSARAVRNWGKASPADTLSLPPTGRAWQLPHLTAPEVTLS